MPKEAMAHDFLNQQPANYRSAFVDLWMWANDRSRAFETEGGRTIKVARGQLAYSQTRLAKIWRWHQDKVKGFLVELQNEGLITFDASRTTTIITVMDYTIFNPDTSLISDTDRATELATERATELATNGASVRAQKGEGRREKEEGGSARDPKNFPEIGVPGLTEFSAAAEMRGIPRWRAEIEHAWRSEQPEKRWPTVNWQTAVTSLLARWQSEGAPMLPAGQKNGAKKTAISGNGAGGQSAAQRSFLIDRELSEVRERLDACHQTGAKPEAADVQREKELEGAKKELEVSA